MLYSCGISEEQPVAEGDAPKAEENTEAETAEPENTEANES